jgi:hypothetical protein
MLREPPLRNLDFSSWQSLATTLIGLALIALVGVGVRLLVMFSVQQRRDRMNRQINERLRILIAAYKVLGGSFTGDLTVDPSHLRDLRQSLPEADMTASPDRVNQVSGGSDRRRRIRDAVEAALADIILLGTEEQVRLAECAARDLVSGRPVRTHELVVSLRDFIRKALDIDPIPPDLAIPAQGPARPSGSGGGRGGEGPHSGAAGKGAGIAGGAAGGLAAGGLAAGGLAGGAVTGAVHGADDEEHPSSIDHHGQAG